MENEYERLKKEGYTEEEIQVILPQMTGVTLSDAPMGPGRLDKSVSVHNAEGESKKTSSVMVGYNGGKKDKSGNIVYPKDAEGKDITKLNLDAGDYVPGEDLKRVIIEEVSKNADNRIIVSKKTGKTVTPDTMAEEIAEALKESGAIIIDGSSKTGATIKYHIEGEETKNRQLRIGKEAAKNIKIDVQSLLNSNKLEEALRDYVYMREKEEEIIPVIIPVPIIDEKKKKEDQDDPTQDPDDPTNDLDDPTKNPDDPIDENDKKDDKNEIVTVIKRRAMKFALAAILAAIMASHGKDVVTITPPLITTETEETNFNMLKTKKQPVYEVQEKIVKQEVTDQNTDLIIGEEAHVSEGKHASNSQEVNARYGSHKDGNYIIQYMSFINTNNNQIISVERSAGVSDKEAFEKAVEKSGLPADQIKVMVHLIQQEKVLGWVDGEEVSPIEIEPEEVKEYELKLVGEKLVPVESISGTELNFDGTVKLESNGQVVSLNVVDENGKLLPAGSQVRGSDGEIYVVGNLEIKDVVNQVEGEPIESSKITLSFEHFVEHLDIFVGLTAVGTALLYAAEEALRKKKKEDEKETKYKEVEEQYEEQSKLTTAVNKLKGFIIKRKSDEQNTGGGKQL